MKNVEGFSKTGNWYKGNLHCHSTNSDGKLSPKEVVDLFKENGYSFYAFLTMTFIQIIAASLTARILSSFPVWKPL